LFTPGDDAELLIMYRSRRVGVATLLPRRTIWALLKRVAVADVPHPHGREVRDRDDVVAAIAEIRAERPDVNKMVVKLNGSAGGLGNGLVHVVGTDGKAAIDGPCARAVSARTPARPPRLIIAVTGERRSCDTARRTAVFTASLRRRPSVWSASSCSSPR
jgi:hypothetical protein